MKNLKVLFVLLALQSTTLFAATTTTQNNDSVITTENNFLPVTVIEVLGSDEILVNCIPELRNLKNFY